MKDFP